MKAKTKILTAVLFYASSHFYAQVSYEGNPFVPQWGTNTNACGSNALLANGSNYCVAIGVESMRFAGYANECVALGYMSLKNVSTNLTDPTTGCVALGVRALYTTGVNDYNTTAGYESMYGVTSGVANTGHGYKAMYNNNGDYNVATGYKSLFSGNVSGQTGSYNTGLGAATLYNNTSGSYNTAVGTEALFSNTTGAENVAVGYQSMYQNSSNVIAGDQNTAVGRFSLYSNIDGIRNTAIGESAMYSNIDGKENTSFGTWSLYNNTSGDNNVAFGISALAGNTTQDMNVAIGGNASYANQGSECTSVGYAALYNSANSAGDQNTAVGVFALGSLSNPGYKITAVGNYADVAGSSCHEASALGYGAIATATRRIQLGNSAILSFRGKPAIWTAPSDKRFKSNFDYNGVHGIEFIMKLRTVTYNLDTKKLEEFKIKNLPDSIKKKHLEIDFTESTNIRRCGFIAQEVEKAAKESNYDFDGISPPTDENTHYTLCYALFTVPLIKAVQEQNSMLNEEKLVNHQTEELLSSISENMELIQSTGINNSTLPLDGFRLDVKPNPFSEETEISVTIPHRTGNSRMDITNLSGTIILSLPINKDGTSVYKVTSELMNPGMYICSVYTGNRILGSKRIVVEK